MVLQTPKQGTQFLIALLIEFPFLSMVEYRDRLSVLTFTFLLKDRISTERVKECQNSIANHLTAWKTLRSQAGTDGEWNELKFGLDFDTVTGMTLLTYSLFPDRFQMGEFRIAASVIEQCFSDELVKPEMDEFLTRTVFTDEVMEKGIRAQETFASSGQLMVYREGDRIFVS